MVRSPKLKKSIRHTFRLPDDVTDALVRSARQNVRTVNDELIYRLREALGVPVAEEPAQYPQRSE